MKTVRRTTGRKDGYSLVELLVAVIISGILAAVALPQLISFLQKQQLSSSTNQLYQAMRNARALAIKNSVSYAIEFSKFDATSSPPNAYAVYPLRTGDWSQDRQNLSWNQFPKGLEISFSNCAAINGGNPGIQFDYRGNINSLCSTYMFFNDGFSPRVTAKQSDDSIISNPSLKAVITGYLTGKFRIVQ